MLGWLRTLGWLMCVIYSTIPSYWLAIHPYAGYWRSRARSPFRVLLPLWIAMWIVVAALSAPLRGVLLYTASWTWMLAAIFLGIGVRLYIRSGTGFSAGQLGGLPEVLPGHREQRLVTTGIRNRVRHPVYLAHLCEMLAWSVGTGLLACYLLTAFAVLTGAVMIRMEDAELEQRFGEEYREYRRRVPAVIPRKFR